MEFIVAKQAEITAKLAEIDVDSNQMREERANPTAHGRISDREWARLERMAELPARPDPEFRSTMREIRAMDRERCARLKALAERDKLLRSPLEEKKIEPDGINS